MKKALDIARDKAKDAGFAIVGTNHAHGSTGAIGFYAGKLAESGLISFVFSGSMPAVAPHGAIGKVFGTNPLAIGVPTQDCPLILDMATSAIAYYSLAKADLNGEQIPEGVAIDEEGKWICEMHIRTDHAVLNDDLCGCYCRQDHD